MDFKKYNCLGRSRADSNCTKHDLYNKHILNEPPEYNKEDSENYLRVQQTMSGKTYCASKSVIKETKKEFTSNEDAIFDYEENTRHHNMQFNYNTAEVSETYHFANNMPSSSKQQNIQNNQNQNVFENEGEKAFREVIYPKERNDQRKFTEKSTYCRALFNNQDFVYSTLAKNARLQRLVRKLVSIRQKQKEEDLWNNYINELKNKHGYREPENIPFQSSEEMPSERIEDYYDRMDSDPYQNLLEDFYAVSNNFNRSFQYKTGNYNNQPQRQNYGHYVFENQSLCYPTSSQGRLMMLNKERPQNPFTNEWLQQSQHRNFRGNIIFAGKEFKRSKNKTFRRLQPTKSTNTVDSQSDIVNKFINNKSMQTDLRCLIPISEDDSRVESAKERYKQVAKNVERLKRKLEKSSSDDKQIALENIESKLNSLIKTLNTFMVDIRTNNPFSRGSKSNSVSSRIRDNSLNELNAVKSDSYGVIKREEAICRAAHENTSTTSAFLNAKPNTKFKNDKYMKIDKILDEEMDKSNKVKSDIEDIMYKRKHHPRAVQISIEIPTRERSTEVTNSLSKTKVEDASVVEEISNSMNTNNDTRMTIAVNTDPLGLLGLLRISSEAVKQILSYMPHIDYYSYLSMLQFHQPRNGVSNYICNLCGASFERPSQLSDHIQTHNLGYSRDCCVCRHVLDMKVRRPGLFKCRHCGQRFTRAYCCELHEESCAKRLGVPRDVTSTLNLLQ